MQPHLHSKPLSILVMLIGHFNVSHTTNFIEWEVKVNQLWKHSTVSRQCVFGMHVLFLKETRAQHCAEDNLQPIPGQCPLSFTSQECKQTPAVHKVRETSGWGGHPVSLYFKSHQAFVLLQHCGGFHHSRFRTIDCKTVCTDPYVTNRFLKILLSALVLMVDPNTCGPYTWDLFVLLLVSDLPLLMHMPRWHFLAHCH